MTLLCKDDKAGLLQAAEIMKDGGVIAYPTEAVFGLGCDPHNEKAVLQILELKSRLIRKGLILLASDFELIRPYLALEELSDSQINEALKTWPGPYTWVFPASALVPSWIRGDFSSIAVRITKHPGANMLCSAFNGPIVSTSANQDGQAPARTTEQVLKYFNNRLDACVDGLVGSLQRTPTQIRDIKTGKILRFGS